MMKRIAYPNLIATINFYALALAIFSGFRLFLFLNETDRIDNSVPERDIFYSFIMGIRFDLVICGYIMVIPFLLFTIYYLYYRNEILKIAGFYTAFVLFSLAFLINAADIPYFKQFFSRFSVTAFEWADSPVFVLSMIIQEPRYWLYILPFIFSVILFYKISRKIIDAEKKMPESREFWPKTITSIVLLGIMFLGIRGRLEGKSPIRVGTAYFCNNPFLNQMGLNPVFTLMQSVLDNLNEENKAIRLMDEKEAVSRVQRRFNIDNIDTLYPILRYEKNDSGLSDLKNVVVVIMESMSAAKMERHGNKDRLTPFLDSISSHGYYFENTYSAGIHTFNGIFGTLFSFPALFRQHPMKGTAMLKYHGIGTTLKEHGYSTLYFTTHDGQFDNVEGFLKGNDFEKIISKQDYPSEKVKTTLGVPDDFMFEYSIPILNEVSKTGKPFLSVFMTASDHTPYYIPEYFKPHNKEIKKQIVEYADYSIQKFTELAKKQPWYKNTLFVFLADHGAPMSANYDISLDYNHSPLLFYQPEIIKNKKVFNEMAGQIDVFPTIMGLLGLSFKNNTLGIDLFKQERPYIYINADDKFGVINQGWLLIVHKDGSIGLFRYKENDPFNFAKKYPDTVKIMKEYAESELQTFQYLINKRKV